MSGTSLDGVDLAYCVFRNDKKKWTYKIVHAETIPYKDKWKSRLKELHKSDALLIAKTHADSGKYFGQLVRNFIRKHKIKPELINSHGHTIFHQPENGFTYQIGDGAQIAAATGINTVCDFRTKDVALGGQGAPLVPIGDRLLFPEYDYCLNLGGIANISFEKNKKRIAFDICPVNMALNALAGEANRHYDENGKLASQGIINNKLLDELNKIKFYSLHPPKSLGKEWFEKYFAPLIKNNTVSLPDRLRTVTEHIALQIVSVIKNNSAQRVLSTGGGSHNNFLMHCMVSKTKAKIIIPGKKLIDNKEALIFAFLGVLRIRNEINVLKSVTGASCDHVSGTVYSGR